LTQPALPRSAPDDGPDADALVRHLQGLPRRTLGFALWLLPIVAVVNVAVLVWSLGTINLAERLVAPHLLALAGLLVFVPMLANALRLAIWSRFLGLGLGLAGALRVITGTMVANSVTPSAAGGMPIKVLFLIGEGIEARRAISLISFQAAEDALILFGLATLAATLSGFALVDFLAADRELSAGLDDTMRIAVLIVSGLLLMAAAFGGLIGAGILGPRIRNWFGKLLRRVKVSLAMVASDWGALLRRGKGIAVLNLGIAAVQWSVRFSIAGLVLGAFGTPWDPALFWLLQYLVQTISSTVPSPGGVGGAEAGFLLLFAPFVEQAVLLPAMSAWRLLFFYTPLVAAAVTFFVLRRRWRAGIADRLGAVPPPLRAEMPAE
jgi:uncharacterized protein (TIRG00374 family)